jgi:hypothetical protein
MMMLRNSRNVLAFATAVVILSGCATLNQLAALKEVDFSIRDVTQSTLAGIALDGVDEYSDFGAGDMLKLAAALRSKELPLAFTLNLDATNPESNSVSAKMVQLDWTLFLQDKETIRGVVNESIDLPPGKAVGIPVGIEVDLVRFFGSNLTDLVELALNVVGAGGEPSDIRLRARPTINTALGPIRYPGEITIVQARVGS